MILSVVISTGLGPLDFRGPEYLQFHGWLLAACFVWFVVGKVVVWLRDVSRGIGEPDPAASSLTAWEIALIKGQPARACTAALMELVSRGFINFPAEPGRADRLKRSESAVPTGDPFLDTALEVARVPVTVSRFRAGLQSQIARLTGELEMRGYLVPSGKKWDRIPGCSWSVGLLGLIGTAKLAVGIAREKPVGFLIALLVANLILWGITLSGRSRQTQKGRDLIQLLLAAVAARPQKTSGASVAAGGEISTSNRSLAQVAFALYGISALSAYGYSDFHSKLAACRELSASDGSGGGGCGSFSSTSGDGGGGCGGGGCGGGGGGCGGCGGGGD
jgi:uncharacterized protein (TIGR04222 family)